MQKENKIVTYYILYTLSRAIMRKENNNHLKSERTRILHFNSHLGPISVDIDKVLFFNADGNYSRVYIEGTMQVKFLTRGLCYLEKLLKSREENFIRCHYCWLVNINKIESCYKKGRLLIIAGYGIIVSKRQWHDTLWTISDNEIQIIKELSPCIKILPGYEIK